MLRSLVTIAVIVLTLGSQAQKKGAQPQGSGQDWVDVLVKWDTDCQPKGCILETDILRGDSDDSPDPQDVREYIGMYIPIDRATRKPAYFAFHVDPRAQQNNGLFVAFTKTTKDGKSWKVNIDQDGANKIMFDTCDEQSCVARVLNGIVEEGKDSHRMDLLDKFLTGDHLMVLYLKDGKAYRTMMELSPFRKAYQRLLANELKTPPTGSGPAAPR